MNGKIEDVQLGIVDRSKDSIVEYNEDFVYSSALSIKK